MRGSLVRQVIPPFMVLCAVAALSAASAEGQSPEYMLKTSVISAAGAPSANAGFAANGSLGQPTPIGGAEADGAKPSAGFWPSFLRAAFPTGVPSPGPAGNALFQNYPNPFNPRTKIVFNVAAESRVEIVIYDLRGGRVRGLLDETVLPGRRTAVWDGVDDAGRTVASGPYFCRLRIGDFESTRKMLLLK